MSDTPQSTSFADVWKRTYDRQSKSTEPDQADDLLQRIKMNAPDDTSNESSNDSSTELAPRRFWQSRKFWKITAVVSGVVLLLLIATGALAFSVYQQAIAIRTDLEEAAFSGRQAYDSFKSQNLIAVRENLERSQERLLSAQQKYQTLSWTGSLPVVGKYYTDGNYGLEAGVASIRAGLKTVAAIEPHADVLGFAGEGTFEGGTTENRIAVVLETLSHITPELDEIAADISIARENIDQIDPEDYPEVLFGRPLRPLIAQAISAVDGAEIALTEFRPVIEQLPIVAGSQGRKKYLVIFQNDNELRPTGGFMTAYAVVNVENGVVTPEKSDDIYELDQKYRTKPPIPPELGRFLITERQWNLRDMNVDPNFKSSMELFYSHFLRVPGEPRDIDGIIAIDTNILERMVSILGPVEVPGYGTFSAQTDRRCDCPQIIYVLSEIIDRPTPYLRENRKGILAPMMQAILQKTYSAPREQWPPLAGLVWNGIQGRHIQFYFPDASLQAAAESINAAGLVPQMPTDGSDYLTVIDANLAGAKSNLFVETSGVVEVLDLANGQVRKQVELTYRNTHPPSNCNLEAGELCLNGLLNDWTRWYVPKGAQLEEVLGLEQGYKINTDNADFDIIEGVFRLSPLNQTKVRITYSVPYTKEGQYVLSMQKQGGTDEFPYKIITPWEDQEVLLDRDIKVIVNLP